jgi:hypothetical protein
MFKKRINPSPSLSRNGLKSYIIHAATLILFEKNSPPAPLGFRPPPATHHPPPTHPPPPTRPHWSSPLGQEKFQSPNFIFTKLNWNARI